MGPNSDKFNFNPFTWSLALFRGDGRLHVCSAASIQCSSTGVFCICLCSDFKQWQSGYLGSRRRWWRQFFGKSIPGNSKKKQREQLIEIGPLVFCLKCWMYAVFLLAGVGRITPGNHWVLASHHLIRKFQPLKNFHLQFQLINYQGLEGIKQCKCMILLRHFPYK